MPVSLASANVHHRNYPVKHALTPNHFLIGTSSAALPPGQFNKSDLNLGKLWRASQSPADQFWQYLVHEYLPTLTGRIKWITRNKPIKIDDVVIVVDSSLPRNKLIWGRIIGLHPGQDGIRVVGYKTKAVVYRRLVVKLCMLDVKGKMELQMK